MFYNMLDISAINAYVIWKALNPNWNSNKSHKRKLCLLQLGKELAGVSEEAIQLAGVSEEAIQQRICHCVCSLVYTYITATKSRVDCSL